MSRYHTTTDFFLNTPSGVQLTGERADMNEEELERESGFHSVRSLRTVTVGTKRMKALWES
jgi:hypothetical protein